MITAVLTATVASQPLAVAALHITTVVLGVPCASVSVLLWRPDYRGPRLRERFDDPDGTFTCPLSWRDYVDDHNKLFERSCAIAQRC